ncbi:MAG: hypothetical protein L0Y58_25210 [Verrucomicrobia subdivision 3 bacterium]|nr:hypothetical protein [Limisphaerales bacterium]
MKSASLVSVLWFGAAAFLLGAENSVNFNNAVPFRTPGDRLVRGVDGQPLVGTNYWVQLYYGSALDALIPVDSAPARLRVPATVVPGTWSGGGTRTLNGFMSGQTVWLQLRVWDSTFGPTPEQAQSAGGSVARSSVFSYTIPPLGSAPSAYFMENFGGVSLLTPEGAPPTLSITSTNGIVHIIFTGQHTIEASEDLSAWVSLGSQSSPFADAAAATLEKRFYRIHDGDTFSANLVGFYRVHFGVGYTFLGNHLRLPDHRVTEIFPAPPNNTQVFPFNRYSYLLLTYTDGLWEGDDLEMRLWPGDGLVVSAVTPFSAIFAGEVILNSIKDLNAGFSLTSSMTPQSLPLTGPNGLDFPASNGDQIFQYNPESGGYLFNAFHGWGLGGRQRRHSTCAAGRRKLLRLQAVTGDVGSPAISRPIVAIRITPSFRVKTS